MMNTIEKEFDLLLSKAGISEDLFLAVTTHELRLLVREARRKAMADTAREIIALCERRAEFTPQLEGPAGATLVGMSLEAKSIAQAIHDIYIG